METGREYELAVELTYPLRRIGLQQVNQLQQAALLVGALPCARSERCEDGADLWGVVRGRGADAKELMLGEQGRIVSLGEASE